MDINNPNTGYPYPWYTWRSVGSADEGDLRKRKAEILLKLRDEVDLPAGYRAQLTKESEVIREELSIRFREFCQSKSDPFDHVHGNDRD